MSPNCSRNTPDLLQALAQADKGERASASEHNTNDNGDAHADFYRIVRPVAWSPLRCTQCLNPHFPLPKATPNPNPSFPDPDPYQGGIKPGMPGYKADYAQIIAAAGGKRKKKK